MALDHETEQILRSLNPWWEKGSRVRPKPPPYRRRGALTLGRELGKRRSLVHVLRGPRQVGKTTALYQTIEDLIQSGAEPTTLLLVRFDLEPLREVGILDIAEWHRTKIKKGRSKPVILLDEVHKLRGWDEQAKHLFDTYDVRLVLTGSSSVLVSRGQRESLAGRAITLDFPPFLFREVLEAWSTGRRDTLPPPCPAPVWFDPGFKPHQLFDEIHRQPPQRLHSWRRTLERYYNRGGYPRLHSGEVDDDRWADYLVETVFERVLGADIPDLFPVEQPRLLRQVYLEVARRTGTEVSQGGLANDLNVAGFRTSQPVVGKYLHYLADALLIREFRRYPLARSRTARVPVKMTLTDLGVRNAIFRGAPSLWESDPAIVGPLVETLVQTVLRGPGIQTHFWRDYENPKSRRSPIREVDFVLEALDGATIPVEVKFRRKIQNKDLTGTRLFLERFPNSPFGILVTRETFDWNPLERILMVPLLAFLLAF